MDIDALLDTLTDRNPNTGRPASRQTLVDVCSIANRILEYGTDLELTTRNPVRDREVSHYAPHRYRRVLTATERRLIASTSYRARVGVLVMMLAGLRRSELTLLTWDDIDLDGLKISATKSAENRNSNCFIVKTGTKTSWGRVVNITLDLVSELQKVKAVVWSKYACPRTDGGMHTLMSWWCIWDSHIMVLCKTPGAEQASAQEITAHCLRHIYAILLYLSGVDVLTAVKLLGHSSVETTIPIYTHLDDLMLSKGVGKLDSYFSSFSFSSYVCGSA